MASYLFGSKPSKPKGPEDLVRAVRENLLHTTKSAKKEEKAGEELCKYLHSLKVILYGEGTPPSPEKCTALIVAACSQGDKGQELMSLLVQNMDQMPFEARKDAVQVFTGAIRFHGEAGEKLAVRYLEGHPELLDRLILGYDNSDIALNCGAMVRECIHHESLANYWLFSDLLLRFFGWLEAKAFEVASDAFATFKELFTYHKKLVSQFLEARYTPFFQAYTSLLTSSNYVTRRLSLKLLGELLLDKENTPIMIKYISDVENLKIMMNLLKDSSQNIQYEAFHVFKVFVANPNKPQPIKELLLRNGEKLKRYLEGFHTNREDNQFTEEKQVLCQVLQQLITEQS